MVILILGENYTYKMLLKWGKSVQCFQYFIKHAAKMSLSDSAWSGRLYSQRPRPFWRAMAGCIAIGSLNATAHWFVFIALHEPMDVQFHCVIKKASVEEEKRNLQLVMILIIVNVYYIFLDIKTVWKVELHQTEGKIWPLNWLCIRRFPITNAWNSY